MPSSERVVRVALTVAALSAGVAWAPPARAQAQGFAVERFYPSAPGAGWFVMDTLDMSGSLGGAAAVTTSYALKPLVVSQGSQKLAVVQDALFTDFGFAATYSRFRLYLNFDAPLLLDGKDGTVGGTTFVAPAVNLSSDPDTLTDARVGADARLVGDATDPFRLGLSGQLFFNQGRSEDYDTDGTVRAMVRALVAGDVGRLSYAGQLGVHIRPLDEGTTLDGPRGSELLFGAAAGPRFLLGAAGRYAAVVGPEVYGETAFQSFFGGPTTGVEALLSGRIEGTAADGGQLRVKLGAGGGLDPQFGAPEVRVVVGIELFDRAGTVRKAP